MHFDQFIVWRQFGESHGLETLWERLVYPGIDSSRESMLFTLL